VEKIAHAARQVPDLPQPPGRRLDPRDPAALGCDPGGALMTASSMGVEVGPDGRERCWWCLRAPEYIDYHDKVWGQPMRDDRELFEMLVLESFQSGLSWLTILRKRDGFRRAFDDWDIAKVAAYDDREIERLLADPEIVRHRGKIEAAIANAAATQALYEHGETLEALLWRFAPERDTARPPASGRDVAATTPESTAMAKELKRRGFRFVGPTTAYSLMQAAGLVNDHLDGCEFR
jgi:DNA-3-methyladenine glycosylase I